MSKIAIIGWGYIGKGMGKLFEKQLFAIDTLSLTEKEKIGLTKFPNLISVSRKKVNSCDLGIVCVPTPEARDGSCDTSIVQETINWLETPLILIKSTVEPGTTNRLVKKTGKKIAFSPEYMGEGNYFIPPWKYPDPKKVKAHTFQIFGGERETTKAIVDIFVKVMGPHVFYAQTDATTAEMVKYMENSWIAMKVTFANEWYDICEAYGVYYREAR